MSRLICKIYNQVGKDVYQHVYQMSKQSLKDVVSILIKDKDIASCHLLLIKEDHVLVN